MPRNMSFSLTTAQFLDRSKTVTRRKGWRGLRAGDLLCGIEKGMGLKKGEKVVRLGLIRVVSVRREPLGSISYRDVRLEGFPGHGKEWFIKMYCEANGGDRYQPCTRIEFEHVDEVHDA